MTDSAIQVITGSAQEHATEAARAYVETVRRRLHAEITRHGPAATELSSCRRLQESITPEALRKAWPAADVAAALAPSPPPPGGSAGG